METKRTDIREELKNRRKVLDTARIVVYKDESGVYTPEEYEHIKKEVSKLSDSLFQ